MSQFDPSPVAKRLRKLLRKRYLTPHQFAVADALLWGCRAPGRAEAQISYDRLAKLAGVGRTAAVAAVRRLRDLGVLAWQKTRLRVAWSFGIASRQWRNIYRWFVASDTDVATRPTSRVQARKKGCFEQERATVDLLAARRTVMEERQRLLLR